MQQPIEFEDLQTMPYREAWELQKRYFAYCLEQKGSCGYVQNEKVFLVEHPHVYTLGFHGNAQNMLLNIEQLNKRGIEFVKIERGGDITYHGPGQLVVYPIIDLNRHSLGVKSYIDKLEECIIRLLDYYGIKGERVQGATGVWIDINTPNERKICAIGVKCSRFITMHGLALNVNTDLSYFSAINPCGFIDKGVTSIEKEVGTKVSIETIKEQFKTIFLEVLNDK